MLYPALEFGVLQIMTEPCLQAIMARFVTEDKQGGLQVIEPPLFCHRP